MAGIIDLTKIIRRRSRKGLSKEAQRQRELAYTQSVMTDDIPRYPPFAEGIPVVPPELLINSQKEMIGRICVGIGMGQDFFDGKVYPLISNFAEYVHLLPASEHHHHRGAGGLFRHSLEVAFLAMRSSENVVFSISPSPSETKALESRWRMAAFVGGLLHDAGKPITDVTVVDYDGKLEWNIFGHPTLFQWAQENGIGRYYLRWTKNRRGRHERHTGHALYRLMPQSLQAFLIEAGKDVPEALMEALTGLSVTTPLSKIIIKADSASVEQDLREQYIGHLDRDSYGVAVERYIVSAMRALVSEGEWIANQPGSVLWVAEDGVYINWRVAAQHVTQRLKRDNIPGIPQSPESLAEIMLERELAEGQVVASGQEGAFEVLPYWHIQIESIQSSIGVGSLEFLGLKLPAHILYVNDDPPPFYEAIRVLSQAELDAREQVKDVEAPSSEHIQPAGAERHPAEDSVSLNADDANASESTDRTPVPVSLEDTQETEAPAEPHGTAKDEGAKKTDETESTSATSEPELKDASLFTKQTVATDGYAKPSLSGSDSGIDNFGRDLGQSIQERKKAQSPTAAKAKRPKKNTKAPEALSSGIDLSDSPSSAISKAGDSLLATSPERSLEAQRALVTKPKVSKAPGKKAASLDGELVSDGGYSLAQMLEEDMLTGIGQESTGFSPAFNETLSESDDHAGADEEHLTGEPGKESLDVLQGGASPPEQVASHAATVTKQIDSIPSPSEADDETSAQMPLEGGEGNEAQEEEDKGNGVEKRRTPPLPPLSQIELDGRASFVGEKQKNSSRALSDIPLVTPDVTAQENGNTITHGQGNADLLHRGKGNPAQMLSLAPDAWLTSAAKPGLAVAGAGAGAMSSRESEEVEQRGTRAIQPMHDTPATKKAMAKRKALAASRRNHVRHQTKQLLDRWLIAIESGESVLGRVIVLIEDNPFIVVQAAANDLALSCDEVVQKLVELDMVPHEVTPGRDVIPLHKKMAGIAMRRLRKAEARLADGLDPHTLQPVDALHAEDDEKPAERTSDHRSSSAMLDWSTAKFEPVARIDFVFEKPPYSMKQAPVIINRNRRVEKKTSEAEKGVAKGDATLFESLTKEADLYRRPTSLARADIESEELADETHPIDEEPEDTTGPLTAEDALRLLIKMIEAKQGRWIVGRVTEVEGGLVTSESALALVTEEFPEIKTTRLKQEIMLKGTELRLSRQQRKGLLFLDTTNRDRED